MIKNVSINNLKGIATCDLKILGRINLFVGKNNSCKSTLIETIYYGLKEFSANSNLLNMLSHRTNVFSGGQELWFNYATWNPILVDFDTENGVLSLQLNFLKDTNEIKSKLTLVDNVKGSVTYEGKSYSSNFSSTSSINISTYNPEKMLSPQLLSFINFSSFLEISSEI